MNELVEFLRARLSEDEEAALRSRNAPADALRYVDADEWSQSLVWLANEDRVLREVERDRRMIALHDRKHHQCVAEDGPTQWHTKDPCATLRLLTLPYVDHPDYQQEWNLNQA